MSTTYLNHPVLITQRENKTYTSRQVQGLPWLRRNGNLITNLTWESNPRRGFDAGTLHAFTVDNRWLVFPMANKSDAMRMMKELLPETVRIDNRVGSPADFAELGIRDQFLQTSRPKHKAMTMTASNGHGTVCYA